MLELKGKYGTAKVFTDDVDQKAIAQVIDLLNQPYAAGSKIRMMPDIHAGAGCTIGTTMTITDRVCPNLVGVDIGCGMYVVKISGSIDPERLDNRYLLLVGTNDDMDSYVALALTNLKVSGYTIGFTEQETRAAAAAHAIESSPALAAFKEMQVHYKALAPQEPVEEPTEAPTEEATEEPTEAPTEEPVEEPVEEPAEEPVEEPEDDLMFNEDLVIDSAVLKASKIVSGKNATLTAKVSGDVDTIVVLDEDGNEVEFSKFASNEKDGIVTFQAVWPVTGSRGDVLYFTVVAYDFDGLRSSNAVSITVTIK